jgi:hypothetical protein
MLDHDYEDAEANFARECLDQARIGTTAAGFVVANLAQLSMSFRRKSNRSLRK